MKKSLTFLFVFSITIAIAQIDFTPYPGNATHCPLEHDVYTSNVSGSNCGTRTWTITNGVFILQNGSTASTTTGSSVTVRWNNVTQKGKLKVAVTCGTENYAEEKEFVIRSLNGLTPQNPRKTHTLQYCSEDIITLLVDEMIVPHTGVFTNIPAYYADGYEWVLPTGWTDSQGNPGTRITSAPFINVKPSNGCAGGTVSVRGYIGGQSGTCSVRRFSSPATISVNRANLNVSIAFPSGYTGPKCGDTAARTFTANTAYSLNCLSSYTWNFPAGWKWYNPNTQTFVSSPVNISGSNNILLYPTGDVIDQGNITATVNLDCGSLPSVSRALTFQPPNPQVSGPEVICSNGSFTLTDAPPGSSITWQVNPGSLFTSSSGSGATANLQLQSSSVSGGAIITFNIQSTCNIPPIQTYFYAGKVAVPDIGINPFSPQDPLGPGYPYVCPNTTFSVFMWPTGSGFQYDIDLYNGTYSQPDVNLPHFYWIHMDNYTPSSQYADASISARVNNGCGWSEYKYVLLYTEQDPILCPSGSGCELCLFSISPNPSSDELSFEIDEDEWNKLKARDTDMSYQLILKNERGNDLIKLKSKQRKEKFNIGNLEEGTYFLVIKYKQTEEIKRIVIKR